MIHSITQYSRVITQTLPAFFGIGAYLGTRQSLQHFSSRIRSTLFVVTHIRIYAAKQMSRLVARAITSLGRSAITCNSARSFHATSLNMVIAVGDKVPSVDLYEDTPANKVNLAQLSQGKKIIVFAVPGAFTPGCSKTHLPGYVQKADELKAKGYSEIICIGVNDPFVMAAWGKDQNTQGKVRMLADPAGAFTDAVDLSVDLAVLGGKRSKRYSMIIEDGTVKELNVEPDNTGLSCSLADKIK
ncbi:peroxiredoxin-5, mitochondrial isoform X3 [Nasonia vitripennis]|uniref:Peroxiredoxin-5 n=1 Tax=Nasonia vitripennis TaxID=7425 RepID=A0A7M7H9Y3_NASVI|nr:peroxiredoxin-5, mitochondrial isoform X3 [Nasonia vitripennis]